MSFDLQITWVCDKLTQNVNYETKANFTSNDPANDGHVLVVVTVVWTPATMIAVGNVSLRAVTVYVVEPDWPSSSPISVVNGLCNQAEETITNVTNCQYLALWNASAQSLAIKRLILRPFYLHYFQTHSLYAPLDRVHCNDAIDYWWWSAGGRQPTRWGLRLPPASSGCG